MKSLWIKIAETSTARIYALIVGVVCIFLTARILGPERQGILVATIAWVKLFATFSSLSLGHVAQYRIQMRKSENWLPAIFGTLLFISIILSIFAYIVAYWVFKVSNGQFFKGIPSSILIVGFLMLPFLVWEEYGSNLLSAADRLRTYNIGQFAGRTVGLGAIILFLIILNLGVSGALLGHVIGQIIVGLIGFIALWKMIGGNLQVNKVEVKNMLTGSAKLHFNTIGSFLLGQATILMLNHFSTKAEVGWYQIAYQMVLVMLIIPQSAALVLFNKMAGAGPDRLWPQQKRMMLQVLGIMTLFSILAYFLAPVVILFFAGHSFEPSIKVFRLLLPVLLGMSLAHLMTNQWIGRGIFVPTTILTFVTAMANIIFNYFMIPKYGMMGAVWAALISYLGIAVIVQLYFTWWCEKRYRKTKP